MNDMVECGPGDLPAMAELLKLCFAEANISERFGVDTCLAWAQGGLESNKTRLFTDDIGNPTCLVYLLKDANSMFPGEKPLWVLLVYAKPESRNAKTYRKMARVWEDQADKLGLNVIYASEWCWGQAFDEKGSQVGGTPPIGPLWQNLGFILQEKVFVKHLTE